MSSQIGTVSYLKGLSTLASHGFDTVNSAVDAILQLMVEQLGMRSSFLAHFKRGSRQLEVVAVHNLPGGCDIQVGTAVPLSQNFPLSKAERPSSLVLEKLQPSTDLPVGARLIAPNASDAPNAPDHGNGGTSHGNSGTSHGNSGTSTFSRVGCYIGVPVVLTDGTYFGVLAAVDPQPQAVKPQQPEMLVVLARRLANEIERDHERSERKRAQQKLAKAQLALREANLQVENIQKMSDFISVVSHEFRTTLTSIQGFSELMSTEEFNPQELREFAGDINSDAKRLTRMINDLLDLDRLESGRASLHLEQIDLNALIKDEVSRTSQTATKHSMRLQLDDTLPLVEGDRDKLIQVLMNLLSNAIKYAPAGGEVLVMSCLEGDVVHVQVQDHGVGIPPEFLQQVFERYHRVEVGSARLIKGTGLGLPIVRQIIEMHRGKAWVESVYGQGSTFHFTLPVAPKM